MVLKSRTLKKARKCLLSRGLGWPHLAQYFKYSRYTLATCSRRACTWGSWGGLGSPRCQLGTLLGPWNSRSPWYPEKQLNAKQWVVTKCVFGAYVVQVDVVKVGTCVRWVFVFQGECRIPAGALPQQSWPSRGTCWCRRQSTRSRRQRWL